MSRVARIILPSALALLFSGAAISQTDARETQVTEAAQNMETVQDAKAVQAGGEAQAGNGLQSRERVQSPDAAEGQSQEHRHGKSKGGQASPNQAGKSAPAGSKNKSQKSGK